MVEAGTGEYGARMFRGTFMTPHFILGPLALGIERLEGSGIGSAEPASTFTSWLKWTRGVGPASLQFEWRRSDVEWERHDQLSMQAERSEERRVGKESQRRQGEARERRRKKSRRRLERVWQR